MNNVDKGFELIYFYLSKKYVPSFPFSYHAFFLMEVVILIIGLIQAVYEYRKWKSEKAE